jgi:hypothetical protein
LDFLACFGGVGEYICGGNLCRDIYYPISRMSENYS